MSAILLAAGESTRMGRQKALLPWAGVTLIEFQVAQLSSIADVNEIIVVTGHEPERIAEIAAGYPRVEAVHNAGYRSGKVSSIKTGLAAVSPSADAILLLSVDQPRSAEIVQKVVRAHLEQDGEITVPARAGRRGHPIVFSVRLRGELAAIDEDSQGVRAVLLRHAADVIEVEMDDPAVNVDLNAPSDLEDAGL